MRTVVFIIIMFVSDVAIAQNASGQTINLNRFNKYRNKEKIVSVPKINLPPAAPTENITAYIGSSKWGDLYVLPQDNLPMLKPYSDEAIGMPGTQIRSLTDDSNIPGKMPNTITPRHYKFQQELPAKR